MTRRVKVSDLLPEGMILEMPDGREFDLGALGVNDMLKLFSAEAGLSQLDAAAGTGDMLEGLSKANATLNDVLNSRLTDGQPLADYDLPPQTLGMVFAALAGADVESMAAEVRATLADLVAQVEVGADGKPIEASEDGTSEQSDPGEGGAPLPSTKPSPASSSKSDESSAGDLSGGSAPDAPGPASEGASASSEKSAASQAA